MHGVATALAALVLCAPCATGLRASGLRKTLGRGRKLVVEVALPDAADAWDLDVEEASAGVREAGAAALIVPEPLLRLVVAEQARAKGDFPGPLPVLCAMDAGAHTDELPALLAELSQAGAAGVAVSCGSTEEVDVRAVASASAAHDCELLVVAIDETIAAHAAQAGASIVACSSPPSAWLAATAAGGGEAGSEGNAEGERGREPPVALGLWFGDDDELLSMREDGVDSALLLDGYGGNLRAISMRSPSDLHAISEQPPCAPCLCLPPHAGTVATSAQAAPGARGVCAAFTARPLHSGAAACSARLRPTCYHPPSATLACGRSRNDRCASLDALSMAPWS